MHHFIQEGKKEGEKRGKVNRLAMFIVIKKKKKLKMNQNVIREN